jgi:D-alanyl-D-alanine carboxypeptidase/D-alanyl-D-alanine-endopeptidase (penicillin-binding protein 4)
MSPALPVSPCSDSLSPRACVPDARHAGCAAPWSHPAPRPWTIAGSTAIYAALAWTAFGCAQPAFAQPNAAAVQPAPIARPQAIAPSTAFAQQPPAGARTPAVNVSTVLPPSVMAGL